MNSELLKQKEKSAQLAWMFIVLAFFMIQALIWAFAITVTSGDTSHAVVVGYDERALNWDDIKSSLQLSEALGWSAQIQFGATADIKGHRKVLLCPKHKDQSAVKGATIVMSAFHCGRASDVQILNWREVAPGIYESSARIQHGGNWQFTGTIQHKGNRWLVDQRHFLADLRNR